MPIVRYVAVLACLALALIVFEARNANAQTCSITVTNIVADPIDVTLNSVVDVQGTVSVTCSGALLTVGICINLGPGSAGATNAANRRAANGANNLTYGLYTDPARTIPWGSNVWAAGGANPVAYNQGNGTVSRTVYARINVGQQTALPLSYTSTFSSFDASIRYGTLSALLGCELLTTTATTSFTVTANVPKTCRISATNLDFGSTGLILSNVDQQSALSTTCTNTTAYWIGLNGGLQNATNPTQRRMTKGSESVLYGLYRDNSRAQPWGSTNGADTVSGTGNGFAQPNSVFGRVSAQATPSPGVYQDTVVATVNY